MHNGGDIVKKVDLYRMILYFIAISLIFDFFFIVVEISNGSITSGLTLFDRAIIEKLPIENIFTTDKAWHNSSFPLYFVALLSPILMIVFLYLTRNNRKFNLKESNLIFPISIIGLLIYSLFVLAFSRYMDDTSALFSITKGYFG